MYYREQYELETRERVANGLKTEIRRCVDGAAKAVGGEEGDLPLSVGTFA